MGCSKHREASRLAVRYGMKSYFASQDGSICFQVPPYRWARSLCALLRDVWAALQDSNDRIRQPLIATDVPPVQRNAGCFASFLQDHSRLGKAEPAFHLDRLQCTMRGMGPVRVVPFTVAIEWTLDASGRQWQPSPLRPVFHAAEDSLDLGIQMPGADLAAEVRQTETLNSTAEVRTELAAIICHEEPRRYLALVRSLLDQIGKIARGRPVSEDAQCNDLAAEDIDDRGDFESLPQHSKIGHVEMPDLVRPQRVLHVPWYRCDARASVGATRGSRRLFL